MNHKEAQLVRQAIKHLERGERLLPEARSKIGWLWGWEFERAHRVLKRLLDGKTDHGPARSDFDDDGDDHG